MNNDAVFRGVMLTLQVKNLVDSLPCINDHDIDDMVDFAAANSVEFVSLSFTNSKARGSKP